MAKHRSRKRGRPATGRDPVVALRLPPKLLLDIDTWASVYRDSYKGMDRSTAIRCLLLLGLQQMYYRVVDPKDKATFEGETFPLLKFFGRAKVRRWLMCGTGKSAERKPPAVYRPDRRANMPTQAMVNAAADRAEARSKANRT